MKTLLTFLLVTLCSAQTFSQLGVTQDVEFDLGRIEQSFWTGNPASIEDLLSESITMRLADSLYQGISSIQALDLLKKFFADKDSIEFRFTLPGNGTRPTSMYGCVEHEIHWVCMRSTSATIQPLRFFSTFINTKTNHQKNEAKAGHSPDLSGLALVRNPFNDRTI
jgi:hypothetical protein